MKYFASFSCLLFLGLQLGCSVYQSPGRECLESRKNCGSITVQLQSNDLRLTAFCKETPARLDEAEENLLTSFVQKPDLFLTQLEFKQLQTSLSCQATYQSPGSRQQDLENLSQEVLELGQKWPD